MTRLARALRLSRADRARLAHAAALHGAIAVLIRVAPFGWAMRCLEGLYVRPQRLHQASSSVSSAVESDREERIVWAVRTVTALIPAGRTCLTTAMTTHFLLRRSGCDSTIRFGVAPAPDSSIAAHAWVERRARVVVGGETRDCYRALEPLELSASAIAARIANSTPLAGIRKPTSQTL